MTQELFEKAKFGDRFVTRGGQEALFLRLTENSEWQLADFYVKDWGLIRVNRENGKCLNGPDIENDIVGVMPSLPSNLDEAAEEYSRRLDYYHYTGDDPSIAFKAGAEWMAGQGETHEAEIIESLPFGGTKWKRCVKVWLDDQFQAKGDKVSVQIRKKQ